MRRRCPPHSALAAEGYLLSHVAASPVVLGVESPRGLKPSRRADSYGAAKAAPLQGEGSGSLLFCWDWWVLVPVALLGSVLAVPYFLTHDFGRIGIALQRGFALVCHQRPERSFWIFGGPIAVCARCLGIYLGAAIGLLIKTSRSIALRLLIAAALINALDAATELAGLHGNWLGVRFVLGMALGSAGALLIWSSMPDVTPAGTGSGIHETSRPRTSVLG